MVCVTDDSRRIEKKETVRGPKDLSSSKRDAECESREIENERARRRRPE